MSDASEWSAKPPTAYYILISNNHGRRTTDFFTVRLFWSRGSSWQHRWFGSPLRAGLAGRGKVTIIQPNLRIFLELVYSAIDLLLPEGILNLGGDVL